MVLAVSTKSAGALYCRNSPGTPTGKKYAVAASVKSTEPTHRDIHRTGCRGTRTGRVSPRARNRALPGAGRSLRGPRSSYTERGGCSGGSMAQPMAMIRAAMPSMRSVDVSLAGLRLPAGSWATATLDAIQRARRHQRLQGQHPRRRRQRLAVRECRLPPDPRCRSGDQIDGRGGNDNLSGGSALDTKFSARARTSIIGGSGANQLDGGAGADTFRLFSIFDRQGRCDSTSPDHRLQARRCLEGPDTRSTPERTPAAIVTSASSTDSHAEPGALLLQGATRALRSTRRRTRALLAARARTGHVIPAR